MKFPRNARIFRGQLDAAPFASVFFLFVIFVLMGSFLYAPGVRVELPQAGDLPGTDQPTIAMAVDKIGRFYFKNRFVDRLQLQSSLREAARSSPVPLTLLVQGDKSVTEEILLDLGLLARDAGITNLWVATLPPMFTNSSTLSPSGAP